MQSITSITPIFFDRVNESKVKLHLVNIPEAQSVGFSLYVYFFDSESKEIGNPQMFFIPNVGERDYFFDIPDECAKYSLSIEDSDLVEANFEIDLF